MNLSHRFVVDRFGSEFIAPGLYRNTSALDGGGFYYTFGEPDTSENEIYQSEAYQVLLNYYIDYLGPGIKIKVLDIEGINKILNASCVIKFVA